MRRRLLAAVLIGAFIVLAANYVVNVTINAEYPNENQVNANYEAYVGRVVMITGNVVSTSAQSFELRGWYGTYTILSAETVQTGDRVTVVGTLEPGNQLRAVTVALYRQIETTFMYVRSFIALIFVAVLFFSSWRCDLRGWVIRPRNPVTRGKGGA